MAARALARIVDPEALDRCRGPCGRLRLDIPASWVDEGAEIVVTVPRRLVCARCEGGGCDGCQRTGAVRAPEQAAQRQLRLGLPVTSDDAIALRIAKPFAESPIEQLTVELHRAARPSANVLRAETPLTGDAGREPPRGGAQIQVVTAVLLLAAALLAAAAAWHW